MWAIKQKATNEQTKQKLIDTDNRMVVTRGKGGWETNEEGKGGQIYVTEGDSPKTSGFRFLHSGALCHC